MKELTPDSYPEQPVDDMVHSYDRIFLAIVVTGLLYWFNIAWRDPGTPAQVADANRANVELLSEVAADQVLQAVSTDSGLPKSALQIVESEPEVGVAAICEAIAADCSLTPQPSVQVKIASQEQLWIYRLNHSGREVKVEKISSSRLE
ncbi:hypothetical protein [Laspinema olomoucense]|uniref:Uncharacterized protein n=1 Tax=Laspinema olomoucense D3b TaxID=2953688 RepID=A0ABT2NEL7_9CYAN|nr:MULTISPECIES: hypothetical protein [unclassified Laspinema]MCT7972557.1 hypothetical protein [Laspinema sp. D3d]MCT7981147.1 hypothetical protein [Laspinema sp. D3b]MCT7988714.1 hypothetical protein [Laspinema sp. D3a]MCT7992710.1 hypothetical protein [Laspinema sp. D3c]